MVWTCPWARAPAPVCSYGGEWRCRQHAVGGVNVGPTGAAHDPTSRPRGRPARASGESVAPPQQARRRAGHAAATARRGR